MEIVRKKNVRSNGETWAEWGGSWIFLTICLRGKFSRVRPKGKRSVAYGLNINYRISRQSILVKMDESNFACLMELFLFFIGFEITYAYGNHALIKVLNFLNKQRKYVPPANAGGKLPLLVIRNVHLVCIASARRESEE